MKKIANKRKLVLSKRVVVIALVFALVAGSGGYIVWKRNSTSASAGSYSKIGESKKGGMVSYLRICKKAIDSPYGPLWKVNFYSEADIDYSVTNVPGGRQASWGNYRVVVKRDGSKVIHDQSTGAVYPGKKSAVKTVFLSRLLNDTMTMNISTFGTKSLSVNGLLNCP